METLECKTPWYSTVHLRCLRWCPRKVKVGRSRHAHACVFSQWSMKNLAQCVKKYSSHKANVTVDINEGTLCSFVPLLCTLKTLVRHSVLSMHAYRLVCLLWREFPVLQFMVVHLKDGLKGPVRINGAGRCPKQFSWLSHTRVVGRCSTVAELQVECACGCSPAQRSQTWLCAFGQASWRNKAISAINSMSTISGTSRTSYLMNTAYS